MFRCGNRPQRDVFAPTLVYSCDRNSAGGEIALAAGDQVVKGTVETTGAWTIYRTATLGQLRLEAGANTVSLKIIRKSGMGIMNLRSITLSPPAR